MYDLIKKHPIRFLLLACYSVWLVVLLGVHLFSFVQNRILYANGTLAPAELSVSDFHLEQMVEQEGVLITTGSDPQMLLKDSGIRVENFTFDCLYSQPPLMQTAFYAGPGEDYSVRHMVYPSGKLFLLPPNGGESLRFDPDIVPGTQMEIQRIAINEKQPFFSFFIFGSSEWACLLVGPGLLACVLSLPFYWKKGRAAS